MVKHPSKLLTVGDTVESMVLGVDPQARRISLGLKQIEANPWHQLADKYPIGSRLKGREADREQPVAAARREVPGRFEDHRHRSAI
jgi:ribosomal protein S1